MIPAIMYSNKIHILIIEFSDFYLEILAIGVGLLSYHGSIGAYCRSTASLDLVYSLGPFHY